MTAILALCCALAGRAETNAPPRKAAAPAPAPEPVVPAPAPPGLGASEEEVRKAHGEPDGVFRFKNRSSFMYAQRGRFEFEDGRVVRMKWDGKFSTRQPQPVLSANPYTVVIRPESRAPGTRPNERVLRKSDGRYEIITNRPPAAVETP